MAYEEKRTHDDDIGIAPVLKLLRQIISKWWVVVVFVVLFAVSGFSIAKITYEDHFTSRLILSVSNKDKNISGSGAGQTTSGDAQASAVIANTLKYLMQSGDGFITAVQDNVRAQTGKEYDKEQLRGMMSIEYVADTMVVNIKVTSKDENLAYIVADAIENSYHIIVNDDNFPTAHVAVVDSATKAKLVSDSSTVLYTAAGLIIGAALAIIIILVTAKIQNKLLSSEDIKNNFSNIDIIATVSNIKNKKKNDRTRLLITDRNVGLPFIETFKLIRTKFENAKLKKGYSVFAVTSSTESEGKTTCSTNIALSLAKGGKSVLLIDADLRKPAVCKTLGINIEGEKGIYDIVNGVKTFEESVKYIEKYNLYLLVSSSAVADPSETLASDITAKIIAEAKKNFDYVIVDCPPAGVVADAAIVANYVDSMVFVAAEERVAIPQIEYALSDILTTKADIMGCIYNRAGTGTLKVATEKAGGYFSNRYGGYYGSSYYYGSRHHKKKR